MDMCDVALDRSFTSRWLVVTCPWNFFNQSQAPIQSLVRCIIRMVLCQASLKFIYWGCILWENLCLHNLLHYHKVNSYKNISSGGHGSLSPMCGMLFVRRGFKSLHFYKECMSSLALLPPRNFGGFESQFLFKYYTQRAKHLVNNF